MAECTCGWDGQPTWMHSSDCLFRKEQDATVQNRFLVLRVSLKKPCTKEDAVQLARQIADNIKDNAEELDLPEWSNVDEVYYNVNEGGGNDLGM